jgi:hypothetical protein
MRAHMVNVLDIPQYGLPAGWFRIESSAVIEGSQTTGW